MTTAKVAIVMGSDSDWPVMKEAAEVLKSAGVEVVTDIVSAHRTPDKMFDFAKNARGDGFHAVIAGAGGAAHLPGMVASLTTLPVIGVPIPLKQLDGMDSLLSIVQMPSGVPVATVGIGQAKNAGILALRMISAFDSTIQQWVDDHQANLREDVLNRELPR